MSPVASEYSDFDFFSICVGTTTEFKYGRPYLRSAYFNGIANT